MRADGKPTRRNNSGLPWLWAGLLVIVGLLLLLDNFLLLGDFNAIALLPLVLVVAGAQILLRGDLTASTEARSFGITRGDVEAATLEISSAEIDVDIRTLQADWRLRDGKHALVAGQFATNTRPMLNITDKYAELRMSRRHTPLLSQADWKVGLATDLPWQIFVSTHLGAVQLDLSETIIQNAIIATGLGEIRLITPLESFSPLYVRSTLGDIHITTPPGYPTMIYVEGSRVLSTHVDLQRYEKVDRSTFASTYIDESLPLVEIHISGTFGNVYLA